MHCPGEYLPGSISGGRSLTFIIRRAVSSSAYGYVDRSDVPYALTLTHCLFISSMGGMNFLQSECLLLSGMGTLVNSSVGTCGGDISLVILKEEWWLKD
jgi:hypothetical protein